MNMAKKVPIVQATFYNNNTKQIENCYPMTSAKGVVMSDGKTLEESFSDKADNSVVVHKSGDEEILGRKTFDVLRANEFSLSDYGNWNRWVSAFYSFLENKGIIQFGTENDWSVILRNIADPEYENDAATKGYVDIKIGDASIPVLQYGALINNNIPSVFEREEHAIANAPIYAKILSGEVQFFAAKIAGVGLFVSRSISSNKSSFELIGLDFQHLAEILININIDQSGLTQAVTLSKNLQSALTDTDGGYGQRVAELEKGKQDTLTPGNGISIVGNVISSSVSEIVDSIVNAGYVFAGVATPATDPGTPEAKVFYIANGKGTYANFGGLEVTEDEVVVLKYDTAWHKEATGIASHAKLSELEGIVKEINIPFFNRKAYIDLSSAVVGEIYNDKLGSGLYNYAKSECHEGEIFLINTIGNTDKAKAYAILDHDNRVLAVERTAVNKEIVIPTGGVSLYVNSKIDALSYIKKKDNAVEDNKEGISELRTDVGISIGCEYGAINYLTGQYINDTNYCRTIQPIPINANSIIKMLFPISVNKAYMIKYKDGVYVGYAEIGKIDTTEYNYRITYDGSYDSFELRFDVKPTAEQLSSVKIIYSQGVFINELGKAIKDIATIKTDIDDLKEKQSDLYDKEYFVDRVNQYVDLNYNVGDYADLTKHEKFSGYGYVIVELYQGESVTANVSGGTVRAKSITVIGRSGIILFNKTYTYNDTYTASEDCLVIFNMRIADGYRIVAHKDKSKMYNQDIYTDVVFNTMLVKRLNLSGYRNIGEFGKIIIDELYSHYLALVPNHNLPHTKDYGFITTDADFVQEFEDSNDELKMMRAKSPCFFYDGKRKGCIVLFDEVGEAYIIDNTGNKKYITFK